MNANILQRCQALRHAPNGVNDREHLSAQLGYYKQHNPIVYELWIRAYSHYLNAPTIHFIDHIRNDPEANQLMETCVAICEAMDAEEDSKL